MRQDNKGNYTDKFTKYLGIMTESLKRKDFMTYDSAKGMLDDIVEECRREEELLNEIKTNNFGILNHIVEENLPKLFKNNQKAVGDIIKIIKEDKTLLNQYRFYNVLKNYDGTKYPDFVNETLELAQSEINKEMVRKAGNKLSNYLIEQKILPSSLIDKQTKLFYENCDYLLTRKKRITNITEIEARKKAVADYLQEHKKPLTEDKNNALRLIDKYEESLNENLTKEEKSLVQTITDFKTPSSLTKKQKFFEQLKNECLDKVNEMMDEEKYNAKLETLKEQILQKEFCEDTIVKDIANLLEIRDVLCEN